MLNKKLLLSVICGTALCLTSCANNSVEVKETVSGTTAVTSAAAMSAETTTAAEITNVAAETDTAAETSAQNKKISVEEYFSSRGFEFSERYPNSPRTYEITLDMKDFKNGQDPFEGMDENYLKQIEYFTLLNVDGYALDFLSQFKLYDIIIKDYSGSTDLGGITCSINFDNYMGGDLSTVKCSEISYNVNFENYSGEYPLNGLPKEDARFFYFENFADGVDFSFIADYPNIERIRLEGGNPKDIDFNFIKDCKNLSAVSLTGKSIDAEAWADILKNSTVTSLWVAVEDYSSAEAETLMKAAPTRYISYNLDDAPWLGADGTPTEGVVFYANLCVNTGGQVGGYECKTTSAQAYSPSTWRYRGGLVSTFTNFTETEQKINSVKIFKNDGGIFTEMPFADGGTLHEIDFAVDPESNSDFEITEEIFPFSKCETGIYKAVFDWNGTQLEQQFVINNETEDFLTEEQQEVYDKAFSEAETDLLNSDRGSDISVQENFFMPIYSDEKEVLFKNFVIHGHEDYPYYIWFEEINFHMVNTADGWRFDKFNLWY